jgi:hypothetical protein
MRKEVQEILTLNTKDLPRKKRYAYDLLYCAAIFTQTIIVFFLWERLSHKMFIILAGAYFSILVTLAFTVSKKKRNRVDDLDFK